MQDDPNYKRKFKPRIRWKMQTLPSSQTQWSDDHPNLQPSYVSHEWLKEKEYLVKLGVTCGKNTYGVS